MFILIKYYADYTDEKSYALTDVRRAEMMASIKYECQCVVGCWYLCYDARVICCDRSGPVHTRPPPRPRPRPRPRPGLVCTPPHSPPQTGSLHHPPPRPTVKDMIVSPSSSCVTCALCTAVIFSISSERVRMAMKMRT